MDASREIPLKSIAGAGVGCFVLVGAHEICTLGFGVPSKSLLGMGAQGTEMKVPSMKTMHGDAI